jgi:hypothetical protein
VGPRPVVASDSTHSPEPQRWMSEWHPLSPSHRLPVGDGSTCYRRFRKWQQAHVFEMMHRMLRYYDDKVGLEWDWTSLDTRIDRIDSRQEATTLGRRTDEQLAQQLRSTTNQIGEDRGSLSGICSPRLRSHHVSGGRSIMNRFCRPRSKSNSAADLLKVTRM